MNIPQIVFLENGNVVAFDENGDVIPDEGGSAWIKILQDKLDRGVIDPKTTVRMAGWERKGRKEYTVRELIESGRLQMREIGKG